MSFGTLPDLPSRYDLWEDLADRRRLHPWVNTLWYQLKLEPGLLFLANRQQI